MNLSKTKIISDTEGIVTIDGTTLENVYLGHTIKTGKENQTAEIKRRKRLSWAAFGKLSYRQS